MLLMHLGGGGESTVQAKVAKSLKVDKLDRRIVFLSHDLD